MRDWLFNAACIAGPVLLIPAMIFVLRPLYEFFLREGCELFTEKFLPASVTDGISATVATGNVLVVVVTWGVAFGCMWAEHPPLVGALVAVAGTLAAIGLTIHMVRRRVGVKGRPALFVGLIMFTGGNLPLLILVPLALALV